MADNNQFGLPNNPTSNNESPALPITFSDPFNPSENNTSAPIGSPSTDLINTDNLSGGSLSEELTTTQRNIKLLTGQDSSDTDVDVLTGISSDAPLVNPVGNGDDPLTDGGITLIPLGANMRQFGSSAAPTTGNQISAVDGTIDSGSLTTEDADNPTRSGSFFDDYELTDVTVGKPVTLELISPDFDAYLQLINTSTGEVIKFDDDGSYNRNSRMLFTPESGTNYTVRVTNYRGYETGVYSLKARELTAISATGESDTHSFSTTDLANPNDSFGFSQEYQLTNITPGKVVTINAGSQNFDTSIELINLDTNDIISSNYTSDNNSQLIFTPVTNANYVVRIINNSSTETGNYELDVKELPIIETSGIEVQGDLTVNKVKYPDSSDKFIDDYQLLNLEAGKIFEVEVVSSEDAGEFDTYLEIIDVDSQDVVFSDNDSRVGTNSRLIFTPRIGRNYVVRVSNYNNFIDPLETKTLKYALNVKPLTEISALGVTTNGNLSESKVEHPYDSKRLIAEYQLIDLTPGRIFELNASSNKFDTYLEVLNTENNYSTVSNNDFATGTNSRLVFIPQANQKYVVRVSNYLNETNPVTTLGEFTLSARPIPVVSNSGDIVIGVLNSSDNNNPHRQGSKFDDYQLTDFTVGSPISIQTNSDDFKTFIQLINANNQEVIVSSDENGLNKNSQLSFIPQSEINYIVRVTNYDNKVGTYSLVSDAYVLPTISAIGEILQKELTKNDVVNPSLDGRFIDDYRLTNFAVGKAIELNLTSNEFTTRIELINADNQSVILSRNLDADTNSTSKLKFIPQANINYIVRVTSINSNGLGKYTLQSSTLVLPKIFVGATGATPNGNLSNDDVLYPNSSSQVIDEYELELDSNIIGKAIEVIASSTVVNANLEILDADTRQMISSGNFSSQNQISRIVFTPQNNTRYLVRVIGLWTKRACSRMIYANLKKM